jgi:hypothetical protein
VIKITYKEASKPPFSDLKPGDCFINPHGDLLMKIDKIISREKSGDCNALNLKTGRPHFFEEGIEVRPVKTEVIVEK